MSPEMQSDLARWCARKSEKPNENSAEAFQEAKKSLLSAFDALHDRIDIPYAKTPAGERETRFLRICEPEFIRELDRNLLSSRPAFDLVASWGGSFPGPLATGATGTAKTRAAWQALRKLWVRDNKPYAWFPVKRLVAQMAEDEGRNLLSEFFKRISPPHVRVILVDDADKINWQFHTEAGFLFQFYDWVYRNRIACITTTNKPRDWWVQHAGEAFVRRLFDDAHFAAKF